MNTSKKGKSYSSQTRHDWVCLEIFLKRDELKQSDMETPFDKIFPDREKEENLDEVLFKFQRSRKKVHVYDV